MAAKTHYKVAQKIEAFYSGGAVSLSRAGDLIACAYYDEVKVVQAATGAVVHTFTGDSEPITALSFSPNSTLLYGGSRSLQLFCWDLESGSVKRSWKGHSAPVAHLCVDESGGLLASASADRTIRVWNTDGFYCTHVFRGHSAVVLRVLFQPKELNVISAAEDGEIKVWDLVAQSCLATLKGHFSAATSLSLTADGWMLLSAGRDSVAVVWDLRTFTKTATIPVFEAVEGAQFLPGACSRPSSEEEPPKKRLKKGHTFATAGERGGVRVWDANKGKCIAEQQLPDHVDEGSRLSGLEICDSGILMSASEDSRLSFLQIQGEASDEGKKEGNVTVVRELVGNPGEVTDLRFVGSPANPSHIAVATNSSAVQLYSLASGTPQASLHGHTDMVLALDCVNVGQGVDLLASGSKDHSFKLWKIQEQGDVQTSLLASIRAHSEAVTAVAFGQRSGGHVFATASSDKMLKLWDLKDLLGKDKKAKKQKDLQSIAAVEAHEKDINCVAISPNEALVCTTSQDRSAKIWKLPSLVLLLKLSGHKRGVWAAAFSPLEQIVATVSGDRTLRLWSIKDGSCLKTLQGHTASVLKLTYFSSGLQIMSCGGDGLLKLWDVRSGTCTATFEEQEGKVWALTSGGAQDRLLASGGADSAVVLWQDASKEKADEADLAKAEETSLRQDFSNALQKKDFTTAAKLAFRRRQPAQLLAVLKRAEEAAQESGVVRSLVASCGAEDIKSALQMLRDWNTQARSTHQAQLLLHEIILQYPPKELREIQGTEEILSAIVPYTQRHVAHLDRLLCSSFILDYSLSRLQYIRED